MMLGYTLINTATGKRFDFFEKSDHLAKQWVEGYCEPEEVACAISFDADGNEVIVPIHRKRIYKVWAERQIK